MTFIVFDYYLFTYFLLKNLAGGGRGSLSDLLCICPLFKNLKQLETCKRRENKPFSIRRKDLLSLENFPNFSYFLFYMTNIFFNFFEKIREYK